MKSIIQTAMLILGFVSTGAVAAMPENEYICKVQTVGVKLGAVFVQADTRAVAAEMASGATARTVAGNEEQAQSTLECIQIPGETFQDKEFDSFVRSIPR